MKLYTTITSERATKGQGGNKFLDIVITSGKEQAEVLKILILSQESYTDKYTATISKIKADNWMLFSLRNAINRAIEMNSKGEKKKGDNICPKYNEQILPDENGNCSLCGGKHKGML